MPIRVLEPTHPDAVKLDGLINQFNEQADIQPASKYAFGAYSETGEYQGGVQGRFRPGAWAELNMLAVIKRHNGVGSALYQYTEAFLKTQGCIGICLSTLGNQAENFYRKHGFHEYARLPKFAGAFDRIFMKKEIA